MRTIPLCLVAFALAASARADLIIVQKVEGGGTASEVTMKVKGDKSRIDLSPQLSTIFDSKSGEMAQLMIDQKTVVRMSGEKMKAMADTIKKYSGHTASVEKPKLTPTGKKETINGYEADQYVAENSMFKGTYWIAPKYPDAAAILKQLQAINPAVWDPGSIGIPGFQDFPGLPIKTVVSMNGNEYTSTIVSIKQEPVNDSEFVVPKEFKEVDMPAVEGAPAGQPNQPAAAPTRP